MATPTLTKFLSPGARVDEIERGWRLSIPAGGADKYRNAQLDDYARLPRRRFPHRFPPSTSLRTSLTFSLLARTSSDSIPGTWGFGLWNDPFGLSLGFGGNPLRLPALPNAVWFFGASRENYLSFQNDKPANGFLAQTFRAPKFHPLLMAAGMALPFSRRATRRVLGKVIAEDGVQLWSAEARFRNSTSELVDSRRVDSTEWRRYSLTWEEKRVSFEVDNVQVFESPVSPNPPLGLVVWIDNQYAAFTPEGKIGFGVLANSEPAWLEIKELEIGD
ncbi:MAG: hypothetical protein IT314_14560 [Anaerolineales bacterium]|nr:hypothetical protein [Anaerolineales bacterium]